MEDREGVTIKSALFHNCTFLVALAGSQPDSREFDGPRCDTGWSDDASNLRVAQCGYRAGRESLLALQRLTK